MAMRPVLSCGGSPTNTGDWDKNMDESTDAPIVHRWPEVPEGWTYEEMCAWAYQHDANGNLAEENVTWWAGE